MVYLALAALLEATNARPVLQAQCGDAKVEKTVEEKIDQFYTWVEKHPRKKGQVQAVIGAFFLQMLLFLLL